MAREITLLAMCRVQVMLHEKQQQQEVMVVGKEDLGVQWW